MTDHKKLWTLSEAAWTPHVSLLVLPVIRDQKSYDLKMAIKKI